MESRSSRLKTFLLLNSTALVNIPSWFTLKKMFPTSMKDRWTRKRKFFSGSSNKRLKIASNWSLELCSNQWLKRLSTWLYISVSQAIWIPSTTVCMLIQIQRLTLQNFNQSWTLIKPIFHECFIFHLFFWFWMQNCYLNVTFASATIRTHKNKQLHPLRPPLANPLS